MIILNRWYLNVNLLNSLTKYDCVSMDRELGPVGLPKSAKSR